MSSSSGAISAGAPSLNAEPKAAAAPASPPDEELEAVCVPENTLTSMAVDREDKALPSAPAPETEVSTPASKNLLKALNRKSWGSATDASGISPKVDSEQGEALPASPGITNVAEQLRKASVSSEGSWTAVPQALHDHPVPPPEGYPSDHAGQFAAAVAAAAPARSLDRFRTMPEGQEYTGEWGFLGIGEYNEHMHELREALSQYSRAHAEALRVGEALGRPLAVGPGARRTPG